MYKYLIIVLILLTSCVSPAIQQHTDFFNNNPALSYDDAIKELGEPDKVHQREDVFIAIWDRRKYRIEEVYEPNWGAEYGYDLVERRVGYGVKIHIIFYNTTKKMKRWKVCSNCNTKREYRNPWI